MVLGRAYTATVVLIGRLALADEVTE